MYAWTKANAVRTFGLMTPADLLEITNGNLSAVTKSPSINILPSIV